MNSQRQYVVHTHTTSLFSGTLSPKKLQEVLNAYGADGWRFVKSIHETKRVFFFFGRESHFLVFEREY